MSYLVPLELIGGRGGHEFDLNGVNNGATLQKLWVWVGGWQVKAIKAWLSDGRSSQFGNPSGSYSEFVFQDGEYMTSLSLWGNGAGTRAGGIKFRTNRSREFFARMTDWGLKTEYPIDVIPDVSVEEIKSVTYENKTSLPQEYGIKTSKTIIKTSSWSVTTKIEFSHSVEVKAGIPEVIEGSSGYSLTVGIGGTYSLKNSEQKTEDLSFTVHVPSMKMVNADITFGRATVDLPYTGTVQITCQNDSVLQFPTSGTYKGVSYTKAKMVVKEIPN